MQLKLSTWMEIEAYLKKSTGIIIPIGSMEQHGPMGLIGTDSICPEKVAMGIAEKTNVVIGPTLSIGMSQHHLGFSGSITLRPSTLMAVIKDVVYSLNCHGFTHMFFLNGHGGNVAPVKNAFSEIYAEYSLASKKAPMILQICNWYEGKRIAAISEKYFKDAEGSHATPSEVSLSFFAHPEAEKRVVLSPQVVPDGNFRDAANYRETFPDGRIGSDSSLASISIGEEIFQAAITDVLEAYEPFLSL